MVCYLKQNENEFVELLAQKTSKDFEQESKQRQQKLQALIARNSEVDTLFGRVYEDNVNGKISDERFMQLSQRYDGEQKDLKQEILALKSIIDKENHRLCSKDQFLRAIRKFMEMKKLTPVILHELVEKIEVYHIQGVGKSRTQEIVIHYNFVGVLDLPEIGSLPNNVVLNSRQGVAVEYSAKKAG